MNPNWYDLLLGAAQAGDLDPADIPTVLHWKGRAMRLEEFASHVLSDESPSSQNFVNEMKHTLIELSRNLTVNKINFHTVRRHFAHCQLLLFLAAMKIDLDLELAVLNYIKELEAYASENAGYPYSD